MTTNTTQQLIDQVCKELSEFLQAKNRKYGDSAINPIRIFSRADNRMQLDVRIDGMLSRIASSQDDDTEDAELDLIGYLVLKRVANRMQHPTRPATRGPRPSDYWRKPYSS